MKVSRHQSLVLACLTAFPILSHQAIQPAVAQSISQSSPPALPQPTQQSTPSSFPAWFRRIGMSYQGSFWKNGKVGAGSTLFYLSNRTGLTGMYITLKGGNGDYLTGDLSNCQAKAERTIHCQWTEPNQRGEFEATFSPDFLSFKGWETVSGDSAQHPWEGQREPEGATVTPSDF